MTIIVIAILVGLILFLVWSTEKMTHWESDLLQAAKKVPLSSRLLLFAALAGCLGFWWFSTSR